MRDDIGKIIKKYRIMQGFSQAQLAAELGISAPALSAYESGTRIPKIELREQIAHILKVDPVELSGLELTQDDEIRLLNKLLAKYAISMELSDEAEGRAIKVSLPEMFIEFQEIFTEHQNNINELQEKYEDRDTAKSEVIENAKKELDYWLETWPEYDFTYQVDAGQIDPITRGIHSRKEVLHSRYISNFFDFQEKYYSDIK